MRRRVLKDAELQAKLDRDGFVVIDMFSANEFSKVKSILNDLNKQKGNHQFNVNTDYKLSFFSTESAYRKQVFNSISSFCLPIVNRFLDNYEPLIVNTFDKEPGEGEVPIHQNWTFVDESQATSVSVWIPMINTTRTNGTMEVVKGSHRVLSNYRGPSIPWVFENLRHEIRTKYMEPIDAKIGQAVVLDDSILHYTSRNDSTTVRSAIQLIMTPNDVPAVHYHLPSKNSREIDVYEVDWEFFTRFNMNEPPTGVKKIDELTIHQHFLTEDELVDRIALLKVAEC
jgi:hypothetical protein